MFRLGIVWYISFLQKKDLIKSSYNSFLLVVSMVPANTLVPSLHYQSFTDETELFGSHENQENQDLVRKVFLVLTI